MKQVLRFKPVKIVKDTETINYHESEPSWKSDRLRRAYTKIDQLIHQRTENLKGVSIDHYIQIHDKEIAKYHRHRKSSKAKKQLSITKTKWLVIDIEKVKASTKVKAIDPQNPQNSSSKKDHRYTRDEILYRADSIDDAKRWCIKNDCDFGIW